VIGSGFKGSNLLMVALAEMDVLVVLWSRQPAFICKIQITLDNLCSHPLASFELFGEIMQNIIMTINQIETDFTCWWWWANSHGLAGGRI